MPPKQSKESTYNKPRPKIFLTDQNDNAYFKMIIEAINWRPKLAKTFRKTFNFALKPTQSSFEAFKMSSLYLKPM